MISASAPRAPSAAALTCQRWIHSRKADFAIRSSHHCALLADPGGAADRPQPSFGRNGRDYRIGDRAPGYNSIRPNEAATVAEILKLNGYNTAAFGKMHQTPAWEVSVSGPFTRWPIGDGFEKFYGFLGGETNQWAPMVFDGVAHVEPQHTPGYNFMTDMTDQAIAWMRFQHTMTPDKPFFIYFAPGALHAPHHTPKVWRDKYRGKFDEGWDKYREETLARQKQLGLVPQNTQLAPWPSSVKHWDELSDDDKRVAERLMENYAGFGEYADHEVGRLIDSLKEVGVYDNTVISYIAGDNGMSAEGGLAGTLNEMAAFNGVPDTTANILAHLDDIGGPNSFPHIPVGWALAGDTPFQWTKQMASHYGGTRNGMVISWPARINDAGGIRTRWHHVIDITPTILEAAKLPQPRFVNGINRSQSRGSAWCIRSPMRKPRPGIALSTSKCSAIAAFTTTAGPR
jgi:arylsulfatase A-like enzyme